ncbi:MAG: tRNA-dihydrouridine synthase [Limnochordia bacterium]|jgi:2,4-dienoyl-CoA reductase-like NADH-dependent reductase (Old Yellow Enzyme family)
MRLLEELHLGEQMLRNRIVFPPMVTNLATAEGYVTDEQIDYYRRFAAGGAALVIVEATFVDWRGRAFPFGLGISNDDMIPGLKKLATAIKDEGALAAIQIFHAGARANGELQGVIGLGPTGMTMRPGLPVHPIDEEGMGKITQFFVQGAQRAVEAGFDLICLHMAHGYLLSQFLSPLSNKRGDAYGQDRAKFPLEVLEEVRKAIPGTLLSCRINGWEPGGLTPEAAAEIALRLEEKGADLIDVSGGFPGTEVPPVPDKSVPNGCFLPGAAEVKKRVSVPVIGVGRIIEAAMAEEALAEGKADLIAIGRGLLADPLWAQKLAKGEPLKKCVTCMGCHRLLGRGGKVRCVREVI